MAACCPEADVERVVLQNTQGNGWRSRFARRSYGHPELVRELRSRRRTQWSGVKFDVVD
jgi:hypothetical protein